MGEINDLEKYLLPRLENYAAWLTDQGMDARLSMDKDEIPGLLVNFEEKGEIFITFTEGEDDFPEIMRLSLDYSKDASETYVKDLRTLNFLVDVSEVLSVDQLKYCIDLMLSGRTLAVYPTADLVHDETGEEEPLVSTEEPSATDDDFGELTDIDEDVEPEREAVELTNSYTSPRVNALTLALKDEGAENAESIYSEIPYVLVVDAELVFVCAFETLDDNTFILHFRADIPVDKGEDLKELEEKVTEFNESHHFTTCHIGIENLDIYDDTSENVITFHGCTLESGDIKSDGFYGFFTSLFEFEVMDSFVVLTQYSE